MKGWIALDIDGTITDDIHSVPPEVGAYLASLVEQGWRIMFITGRTFSFGQNTLKSLRFPYFLAVQNGADIIQMPERKVIARYYLTASKVIPVLEQAYQGQKEDFIVYAGYEKRDFCYWRPKHFSKEMTTYMHKIQTLSPEPWVAMDDFIFDAGEKFPLIKCLGSKEVMEEIQHQLKDYKDVAKTLIRDPLSENLYLILITDAHATKGRALEQTTDGNGRGQLIIAAGDDLNDLSMLQAADVGIAMESAPEVLLREADIIAPRASELGIIEALKQAVARI